MKAEDEKRLQTGPLNCPWKDYANKAICMPECKNYAEIARHVVEFYNYRVKIGQPISVDEIIVGIEDGIYPRPMLKVNSRAGCNEQPKIPVTVTEIKLE